MLRISRTGPTPLLNRDPLLNPLSPAPFPILLVAAAGILLGSLPAHAGPAAPPGATVDLLFNAPGCLGSGANHMSFVIPLFEHFENNPGDVLVVSVGEAALSAGDRYVFPMRDFTDTTAARRWVSGPAYFFPEVLADDLPVLVSPNEVLFQIPYNPELDWLEVVEQEAGINRRFPNLRRTTGRLVRHVDDQGSAVVLEIGEGPHPPPSPDLLDYTPQFGGVSFVTTPESQAAVYMLGRRIGRGSRIKADLGQLRGEAPSPPLVLQPGGVAGPSQGPALQRFCAVAAQQAGVDVLVPSAMELGLGPDRLTELAAQHGLRYLAANLEIAGTAAQPFPRYLLTRIDDLWVAVIGMVGANQLQELSTAGRAGWTLRDPELALEEAAALIHRELGRRPDLSLLLVPEYDPDVDRAIDAGWVDGVIGGGSGTDLRRIHRRHEIRPTVDVDYQSRFQQPVFRVRVGGGRVGRLRAQFVGPSASGWQLTGVEEEAWAVMEPGDRDREQERAWRSLEEERIETATRILLPDPARVVAGDEALSAMVWGDRILHRGRWRPYPEAYPAVFSDALWMRVVTNAMALELATEVALSRNLDRRAEIVGAVPRWVVEKWVPSSDAIRRVRLSGKLLNEIATFVAQQRLSGGPPNALLFAAGLDPAAGLIRGRTIDADQRYWVALTDAVIELLGTSAGIAVTGAEAKFISDDRGWVADPSGSEILLRDLILATLEREAAQPGAAGGPGVPLAFLEALVADLAAIREPQWSLNIEEISLRGSIYGNTANVAAYAGTGETRLTSPDNTTLVGRGRIAMLYDDPSLAWETRLNAEFSQQFGDEIDEQNPIDDLRASTDLRLNAFEVMVGEAGTTLKPYVRLELDTEFTPPPDPDDEDATLPHQKKARADAGLHLSPSQYVDVVKLGGVFEVDFSDPEDTSQSAGLNLSYELKWALTPYLVWTSRLSLRYLIDDGSEATDELGLVIESYNKLSVPVSDAISLFAELDLYGAQGRGALTREMAASWLVSGGIELAWLIKS